MRMKTYRITKYDPRMRDASGAYNGSDWTAYSDVGQTFGGRLLTESEYLRTETLYVNTALSLLCAGGIRALTVAGLEDTLSSSDVKDGQNLDLTDLATVFRRVLREEFWCRFEGASAYVHFGWDYYMYVGVPDDIRPAVVADGLYVEEMESPYANQENVRTSSRVLRRVPRRK
jgi:hypothetical protein